MRSGNKGTTLVELMISIVIASIVAIGFSSVLMYTRNMYNDSVLRSQLSQDALVVDQYVRTKLTEQVTDSLQIFASQSDEDSETTSTSGIILRAVRPDSTVDHVMADAGELVWQIDSVTHNPIDSQVSGLMFTERDGYSKKILTVQMSIVEGEDSLSLEWIVAIRN